MTNFEKLKNDIDLMADMLICPHEDENGFIPDKCGAQECMDCESADVRCRECAKRWLMEERDDG